MNLSDTKWNIARIINEAPLNKPEREFIKNRINATLDEFAAAILKVVKNVEL